MSGDVTGAKQRRHRGRFYSSCPEQGWKASAWFIRVAGALELVSNQQAGDLVSAAGSASGFQLTDGTDMARHRHG
ncbi:hypothetical protein Y1Q_0005645 [Alligator mississippiensis]|uniref:Uncharacterized protein n=1 Tax=Alligator mississippiensis TaxID=8496 RepID=A0A151MFF5_ALLMI|nr:hypothetical protein Y1Q_0005645 [Alligator mississippiensis]